MEYALIGVIRVNMNLTLHSALPGPAVLIPASMKLHYKSPPATTLP